MSTTATDAEVQIAQMDTNALTLKAIKTFQKSGDRFFTAYKKMHDALVRVDASALDETKIDLAHDELLLVLRLWAGELQRPKKRSKKKSLYECAIDLTASPLVLAACHAVCLELAWDWVQTECGNRLSLAEESEHWDEDANAERVYRWANRHDNMSNVQGQCLSALADNVLKTGDLIKFKEGLAEGIEELECE